MLVRVYTQVGKKSITIAQVFRRVSAALPVGPSARPLSLIVPVVVGTTGIAKVNDLDFEFSVWVHLAVLRIEKERLFPRYVELALNSPHCYAQSQHYTRGISNFDLGLTRMIKITIPLPPLPEQRRIVAKVDELMALCGRLEAQLNIAQTESRRLLEAILDEAERQMSYHCARQAGIGVASEQRDSADTDGR
jgi:type I restriction modification DNA specificity protein